MSKETTLSELGEMMERGFAAIASDIAEIKSTMATKEDAARLDLRLDRVETRLSAIELEVAAIHRDLDDLREKYENVSGFRKEIDHALERIAEIEKKLAKENTIAA
jgi:archaellum component FlaC